MDTRKDRAWWWRRDQSVASPGSQLIAWAADDDDAARSVAEQLRAECQANGTVPVGHDIRTAGSGRGEVRRAVVASTPAEALERISQASMTPSSRPEQRRPPIALLLPGQGAQHDRMAVGLYGLDPVFTDTVDEVLGMMGTEGERIGRLWLDGCDPDQLDDVRSAQPLLFAVEFALATMVQSWGVRVAAFLGHSIGEMVAATLTGVLSLPDAVRMIQSRVAALAMAPPGGMLAVAATPAEVAPLLTDGVSVAAVNGSRQVLLAGLDQPLALAGERLATYGVVFRRARASTAFHNPVLKDYAEASWRCQAAALSLPDRRVVSCYTTADLDARTARDPGYWASHPVAPVLFHPALGTLLSQQDYLLLETGPSQGLSILARQHHAVRHGGSSVLGLLPGREGSPAQDRTFALQALAELWRAGYLDLW
jgi:acyl transferase domain-containing protein